MLLIEGERAAEDQASFVFGLLLVLEPPPGDLVLRAGPVTVGEAVAKGRGDFLTPESLADFAVSVAVVPYKGRQASLFSAGFFDGEINVGDDGGLGDLGVGLRVFLDPVPDHFPELAVSGSLLGEASLSDHHRAIGGSDLGCGRRSLGT